MLLHSFSVIYHCCLKSNMCTLWNYIAWQFSLFLYPYALEVIGWLILMKSWKELNLYASDNPNVLYCYIELP